MSNIRRSIAFAAIDSYVSLALQLGSTVIISRILSPEETGIFAVAAVFSALASTFRDFGVAEYLIQEEELTNEKIRAAFAVNISISWFMGMALYFSAPLAADFYRSDGVAQVMRLQALNFVLIPFGAVTMACFRRDLNFKPILLASIAANSASFIVSVGAALYGLGFMSLAWSSLIGVTVTVAFSMLFRPHDFPKWPSFRGIGEVIRFGKFASGIYVFGQLSKGSPEMIIGRAQNLSGVAIFSRATGLVEIFNRLVLRAVMPVCLPYFSKSGRESGGLMSGYLTSVSYLTAIGWPFLAFLGITAYSAIRIVYGSQWIAASPLAQVVCAAAAINLIYQLAKEVLLAQGRAKASNTLQMGIVSTQLVGLLAVVPFGLFGAALGLLGAAVVGAVLSQRALHEAIGLRVMDVFRASLPSVYITVISVLPVAMWATVEGIAENNFARFTVAGGAITAAGWILAVKLLGHPLWHELVKVGSLLGASFRALMRR